MSIAAAVVNDRQEDRADEIGQTADEEEDRVLLGSGTPYARRLH